jgi:hypothetical protein
MPKKGKIAVSFDLLQAREDKAGRNLTIKILSVKEKTEEESLMIAVRNIAFLIRTQIYLFQEGSIAWGGIGWRINSYFNGF